jgi:hypothetical protein
MQDPLADAVACDDSIFGRRGARPPSENAANKHPKSIFHVSAETENAAALQLPPAPKAEPREGSR